MKTLPYWFVAVATLFVIAGMAWGVQMSITQDHLLAPAHAHNNLIGFVVMVVYGFYYRLVPAAAAGGRYTARPHPFLGFAARRPHLCSGNRFGDFGEGRDAGAGLDAIGPCLDAGVRLDGVDQQGRADQFLSALVCDCLSRGRKHLGKTEGIQGFPSHNRRYRLRMRKDESCLAVGANRFVECLKRPS